MQDYILFLGNCVELSYKELTTLLNRYKSILIKKYNKDSKTVILSTDKEDKLKEMFNILGGSIKVAKILKTYEPLNSTDKSSESLDLEDITKQITSYINTTNLVDKRISFGLNFDILNHNKEDLISYKKQLKKDLQSSFKKIRFTGSIYSLNVSSSAVYYILKRDNGISMNITKIDDVPQTASSDNHKKYTDTVSMTLSIEKEMSRSDRDSKNSKKSEEILDLPELLNRGNRKTSNVSSQYILSYDIEVQDIQYWQNIDMKKPYKSLDIIGMLPPKLARIMVNLARLKSKDDAIWDPFCGTGTLLLQSLKLGYISFGSDQDPARVKGTAENIEWAFNREYIPKTLYRVFTYDIFKDPYTKHTLKLVGKNDKFSAIITEPYLGPIGKNKRLDGEIVKKLWLDLKKMYNKIFTLQMKMLLPGKFMIIVVPVFKYFGGQNKVLWYNPKLEFSKNFWKLDSQFFWRDNVKYLKRKILILQKK